LCAGGFPYGKQVWEEGPGQSREGDARAQEGHAAQRRLGQEGDEPQAGHRHRSLGSAPRRREGAAAAEVFVEEVVLEDVEQQEVEREEVVLDEEGLAVEEEQLLEEEHHLEEEHFEEVEHLEEVDCFEEEQLEEEQQLEEIVLEKVLLEEEVACLTARTAFAIVTPLARK
jgi:hypothetical protein